MRKDDFPILLNTGMIYLDNSATSQKPQQVIEAITHFYENSNANVHRGIYRLSQQATVLYEKAHERLKNELQACVRDKCQVRATIDIVPYGSLPRAEFKAKRVLDLRKSKLS